MSSTLSKKKEKKEKELDFLKEAVNDKEALAHLLSNKAINEKDKKMGEMYYLFAGFLRDGEIKPFKGVIATDGKNFYVGPLYLDIKEKYGEKIVPFLWLHEVMHVVHAHPERMKLVLDTNLYNIVADLYVNEMLENRFGKIPDDFVTLSSFLNFIIKEKGRELKSKEKEAILKIIKMVPSEEITVEEAYSIIEKIPVVKTEFKRKFENSSFFGKDVKDNQKKNKETNFQGSKEGNTDKKEGGNQIEDKDRNQSINRKISIDENEIKEIEKKLKEIRKDTDSIFEKIKRLLGEFNAFRFNQESKEKIERGGRIGKYYGGIYGVAEYKQLQNLRIELEKELEKEIGKIINEYETNFSRFSDDAYWLPEEKELYKSKVYVLIDVSPSISIKEVILFLNWLNQSLQKYKIDSDVIFFASGAIKIIRNVSYPIREAPLSHGGTFWDKSIGDEFKRALKEEVPIVFVLSDFNIHIYEEVERVINRYKSKGGKISCWSVEEEEGHFCDRVHHLPKLNL